MHAEHKILGEFLSEVRVDLDLIVYKILPEMVAEKVLSENLYEATTNAWKDLQDRFDEVSKRLAEIKYDELRGAGLSGLQLNFKIEAVNFSRKKFLENLGENRHRRRFLRSLLKAIDSILGSLSVIMPLVEPITEFKEAIDSILP